jgi:Holliday junction DNA helicase RuvA
VRLLVHTEVREDAIELFGFAEPREQVLFHLLRKVKGLGPRTSLAVLSGMRVGDLLAAIAGGDASRLQTIQGVGKRFAERIVVECREAAAVLAGSNGRVPHEAPMSLPGPLEEAVSALVNLGYRRAEAERAVERVAGNGAPLEDVIRGALQGLAG